MEEKFGGAGMKGQSRERVAAGGLRKRDWCGAREKKIGEGVFNYIDFMAVRALMTATFHSYINR